MHKKLLEIYDDPGEWWYSEEIQETIKKYSLRFCKKNENLLNNLSKVIKK